MKPTTVRRWIGILLWFLALVLMMATAVYQRHTGPTYPARGDVTLAGQAMAYKLLRSETTGTDARIALDAPGGVRGVLEWRRYPTNEPFTVVPLARDGDALAATLPTQPPAGKIEYRVRLTAGAEQALLPAGGPAVLRYKGDVPAAVLIPHILFMFLAMVWGLRTLLEITAGRPAVRRQAWITLVLMLLGGMILGPAVQHYAFGAAWTGVPFGWDLTDNKTLLMVVAWGIGCGFVGLKGEVTRRGRIAMMVAGLVMLAVYLIPHSLFGSTLNYEAVDQGADPAQAVEQG
ncbi:MAG: hypothetical protein ABIO70_05665 [Pseudomonadota bacterium]